jgi:DNA polymerase elongation subunit (family B)
MNKVHLWEEINGEPFYDTIDWSPYVFIKTNESDTHTIYGDAAIKKDFDSYVEYKDFCKENSGNPNVYENLVKPETQFLAERYYKTPDDEISVPNLLIYSLDIEVLAKEGFPKAMEAKWPVVLISVLNNKTKQTTTFGERPYTGEKDIDYIHCRNERDLLDRFYNFINRNPPDVITGWNVYHFDITYLIQRSRKLFGSDTNIFQKMSPINTIRIWDSRKYDELLFDIAGINVLDYMDMFKWYSPDKLERHGLDFVSTHVLKTGKLKYDFEDLRELYSSDWNTYVDYNTVDCELVDKLESTLGYIRLVQSLSLLCKCPMKYYQAMTQLIEGALLTYFRRNNMCAPSFLGGQQKHFPAAYVKEPQTGMHTWVIDIDIASSYPSHIITLNMSNETYFGRILDISYNKVAELTAKREFPDFNLSKHGIIHKYSGGNLEIFNKAVKRGLLAIAPCGSVFTTNKPGVIAAVEKAIFYKRKEVKGNSKKLANEAVILDDSNPEKASKLERSKELYSLQWAIKILLNAMFGITAVPYSRYFNTNIAEAITSCGRHTILQSEIFVNEWFNDNVNLDDKDLVAYIDTDSLFIRLGYYFENTVPEWDIIPDDKKIKMILGFSTNLETYVNERIFRETQLQDYNSQVTDFKIMFKQEIIAKTALFVKKKKYAYWIVDDEGTPCDKLAVKGLEIVRSDSAEAIRTRLKDIYHLIMKQAPDSEIKEKIKIYRKELFKVTPEEIAANIGVNNIKKYLGTGMPIKGTPWHVKGVYSYRLLLKKFNLEQKYEDIFEGNKAKVVYVKNNMFNVEQITFNQHWPEEFDKVLMIDYEVMIEKFFMNKIGFLLEPMNKNNLLIVGNTFDDIFKLMNI